MFSICNMPSDEPSYTSKPSISKLPVLPVLQQSKLVSNTGQIVKLASQRDHIGLQEIKIMKIYLINVMSCSLPSFILCTEVILAGPLPSS